MVGACQSHHANKSRVDQLPYYGDANFTPHWWDADSDSLAGFHTIPSFSFINQDGQTITEKTFEDKIYITDFFFTACPGICPKMMTNMAMLQDTFLNDETVLLLSHSVTPERDSVSVLKTYADSRDILSSKWHLVTGDMLEIYDMGRHAYFVEEDLGLEKEPDDFLHTENFVLVDKNKHIRGIYNGLNQSSLRQLIADIRTLKQEG